MFKLSAFISALAFSCSSWYSGSLIPRFTQTPVDYILMPLLGYLAIIAAAQLAVRLSPSCRSDS